MNLRETIIAVMIESDVAAENDPAADDYDSKLDALLDWLDTNAEHIATRSKADAYDQERDRYIGDDIEADVIRGLVAVLRQDTK